MEKITEQNLKIIENNIPYAYITKSEIHGFGLFSLKEIENDSILVTLDGQYIKDEELQKLDIDLLNIEYNYIPSINSWLVRGFLTEYSAINHSKEPNIQIFFNPLRIVAIKNIKKEEELFLDYSLTKFPEYFIDKYAVNTDYL